MQSAAEWLASRSRLRRRLDNIRSVGHAEDQEEARTRQPSKPLRDELLIDLWFRPSPEETLLRDGPWYVDSHSEQARQPLDMNALVERARSSREAAQLQQDADPLRDRKLGWPAVGPSARGARSPMDSERSAGRAGKWPRTEESIGVSRVTNQATRGGVSADQLCRVKLPR